MRLPTGDRGEVKISEDMRLPRTVTGEDLIPYLDHIISYLKKGDIFVQNLCCLEVHDYSEKEKKKCMIMHYGKADK